MYVNTVKKEVITVNNRILLLFLNLVKEEGERISLFFFFFFVNFFSPIKRTHALTYSATHRKQKQNEKTSIKECV